MGPGTAGCIVNTNLVEIPIQVFNVIGLEQYLMCATYFGWRNMTVYSKFMGCRRIWQ